MGIVPTIIADQAAWDQAVGGVFDVSTPWIVLTGDGEFAELEGEGRSGWISLEAGDVNSGQLGVFEGDVTLGR